MERCYVIMPGTARQQLQLRNERGQVPKYNEVAHVAFAVSKPEALANALLKWAEQDGHVGGSIRKMGQNKYFVHLRQWFGVPIEITHLKRAM